jgi:SAM-dependent methyltransferase
MPDRRAHEANRRSWNAAVPAHQRHRRADAELLRGGGSTLHAEERGLLGDLAGRSVAHLLCNDGRDSLSLVQLGARVTGVDISDTAIAAARRLAVDAGLPATFVRMDVYDWLRTTQQRFEVAFSSYGALCWLSDLDAWAHGLGRVLEPGGRAVLVDFHPLFGMFDDQWRLCRPYGSFDAPGARRLEQGVDDYVGVVAARERGGEPAPADFSNPHPAELFAWGLADVVDALLDAGLGLRRLREYPYSNEPSRAGLRPLSHGRWRAPASLPAMPLMFGLVAEKAPT